MTLTVKEFIKDFKTQFQSMYAYSYKEGSTEQLYNALGMYVKNYLSSNWKESREMYVENSVKQVFYFSMEFLPGRQLESNAYNLGMLDTVKDGLKELGISFEELEEAEADP
ncbi:MAG: glucan phosphorylase, partial [Alkalibacterium sp.]